MVAYLYDVDSRIVYSEDDFGKNMLEIVKEEKCIIPVCDIPTTAVRLDCTDEEAWKLVEGTDMNGKKEMAFLGVAPASCPGETAARGAKPRRGALCCTGTTCIAAALAVSWTMVARAEFSQAGYWKVENSPRATSAFNCGWELTVSSEGDGETVRTFEKVLDGVRYVMVVNDNRRLHAAADGLLTTIATNDWYRPYGAPQRITTTVRGVAKGATVYEFNEGEKDGKDRRDLKEERAGTDARLTRDFEAAEGVVYCVYPEPLKAPGLSVSRLTSSALNLGVEIATASGRPAPGRSVVVLTVRDPVGRVTDESGRYVVDRGRREVTVRFADTDPKAGTWTVTARDLTTEKTAQLTFDRTKGKRP